MKKRENFGLLPPKVTGFDPEAAKIHKAYWRAIFESNWGFGLFLVGIACLVACFHYFDIAGFLNGFSSQKGKKESSSQDSFMVYFIVTLLVIILTLFVRKSVGMGQKNLVLSHGLFRIESAEFEKQKHHYTRQKVLELKQTQEYKKLKGIRGGKEQDKWKTDSSAPERKSPSAERSLKQREDIMSTPQKIASPPRDFENIEDELVRMDKEI